MLTDEPIHTIGNMDTCDGTIVHIGDNRTSASGFCEPTRANENKSTDFETNNDFVVNIYRYKFTEEFMTELFTFSKIHQYDHRKDFKEAWNIWTEENNEMISYEIRRLNNLGYDGDILDKMFKSARYYFRKKCVEKKQPVERRNYVSVQRDLLEAMDTHITSSIKENSNYKPSDGFMDFCKTNMDVLKKSVEELCKQGLSDSDEVKQKIKKTYKNRYFILTNK